jgi:DNA-binding SARP family transcriptional activator
MSHALRILGPLEAVVDGVAVPLGGPKQRAVLALLAGEAGRVVSVDRLQEALWPDEPEAQARNLIQVYVSNLRKALAPLGAALDRDPLVRTQRPGYVLDLRGDELDAAAFAQEVHQARADARAGRLDAASNGLETALARWRGPAMADLRDTSTELEAIGARLDSERRLAEVDRVELRVGLGHHGSVLHETAALLEEDPLDERVRGLLMLALYRAGRQADALECFQEGRRRLVEELGIDPGPQLRELEEMILQQAPALDLDDGPGRGGLSELTTMFSTSIVAPRGRLRFGDDVIPLDRSVTTIGRRSDRTIVLDDTKASREHAEVRWHGQGFVVADSGSKNGTSVNGERISAARPLQTGDVIEIGSAQLQFEEI